MLLGGIVACLLFLSYQGFETISAARAYVGGESSWSKAQRDAVHRLLRYAVYRDSADYSAFTRELVVPRGDRQARVQLELEDPDYALVREGFLQGGNHPDDIERLGIFFRRFRQVDFVHRAVGYWAQGDTLIEQLESAGSLLHAEVESAQPDSARIGTIMAEVDRIAGRLAVLEDSFSEALGEGSRWATRVLTTTLTLIAVVLVIFAGLATWLSARRLRQALAALRSKEEQHRALIEHAPFGVVRTSITGRMLSANPAFVAMLGYQSEAQIQALDLAREVWQNPTDRQRFVEANKGMEILRDKELPLRRRDGTALVVRMNGRVLRDSTGQINGFEAFVEDVTQRRATEAQLRQSQKMEAVGQFTGGIAHDFNNLLTIIISSASLVKDQLPPTATGARQDLDALTQAADSGAEMIRKLLTFTRGGQIQFAPHDTTRLVDEAAAMLRRMLPSNIVLQVQAESGLPRIRTDPAAMSQVLLNLATNARDAMPQGGRLHIGASVRDLAPSELAWQGMEPGRYVAISVSDTGTGIDSEIRDRVFEPFFTTKPTGQGTGLGLSMVYGIVQQHHGHVEIASEPGQGTRVTMYFRAVDPLEPEPVVPPPKPVPRGRATILVVEDETALHGPIRRILERYGYHVLLAQDGELGAAMYRQHKDEISLVLSDVVMPNLSGPAMYQLLQKEGPCPPFLFMSGYVNPDNLQASSHPSDIPFIGKPWRPDELMHKIQEILAPRPD
jgi:PAS domain S-box-containing protein